ncbi:DnaT-like ssDNA-binding protein [Methylomicrobium sp. Wu6]|uniref:DnaT-like ssDNA-binding protein n=1 Tax=Methylomicrobium sp. Wu6 TaxID=3107928 RepID=UPI002DD63452|nr:DnaT-like ssDNA-binding protein [Methylomicrobium sp. Wu6]MEC4747721.1 DnaT-like ssDNA-binding protein [Methylomicrobium sp. Wu6]
MTIELGTNSFVGELELYNHLENRLNADAYTFLAATVEAGATLPGGAEVINAMRGLILDQTTGNPLQEITDALTAGGFGFDNLEEIYTTLTAGKTQIQIQNARAAILATRLIDQFDFLGRPTDTNQPLQWPRIGAVNRNGQPIDSKAIPAGVKAATCDLVYFLLDHDITDPQQYRDLFKLSSARVGESDVSYRPTKEGPLPDFVMSLLKPYLAEPSQYSARLIP